MGAPVRRRDCWPFKRRRSFVGRWGARGVAPLKVRCSFAFYCRGALCFHVRRSLPKDFQESKSQVISKHNLASQPFRNRTLPWLVSIVVAVASLVALVYIFSENSRIRAEANVAERQVMELRTQKSDLEEQAKKIIQEIPFEQRETLRAAHQIIDRKTFSWSQLFADLEESLPPTVRVARINVREVFQSGDQTRAELDLSVVGRTPTDVTGMITEMRRNGLFSATPLSETQRNEKGEAGYEWALRVSYVQRSRRTSDDASQRDVASSTRVRPVKEGGSSQ